MTLSVHTPYFADTLHHTRILLSYFDFTAKPEVMEFDKLRSKVEGETAVIECNVTGYPIPEITWYRQLEDTGTLLLLLLLHLYVRTCIFERFDVGAMKP
mgnify:CR=1 FL=1